MNANSDAMPATRPVLSADHLEPWIGNVVDLKMADGTHRFGLLEPITGKDAHLRAVAGLPRPPDHGAIRIADMLAISRAARN
jgi:hypothetical protein